MAAGRRTGGRGRAPQAGRSRVVTPVQKPSRWSALVPLAGLLVGASAPAARAGDPPPCSATASFEIDRATVGQQVLYRVRIASREDVTAVEWIEPPSFPGFRAEWLPGRPSTEPTVQGGVRYRAREERRALFPERPGALRVEAAGLRCRVATDAGERTFTASVPAAALRAVAPPAEERPPDFAGLIGRIALQTIVTPREVLLGQSVRVAVMLRGSGNLWDAPDPLAAIDDADVFPRRPQLTLETGTRLSVKRHFSYDVVPLRVGTLVIPAIRVPYFDPRAGHFATAVTDPVHVTVEPRAAGDETAAEEPDRGRAEPVRPLPAAEAASGKRWWGAIGVALLAAGAGASMAARRHARARQSRATLEGMLAAAEGDEAAALAGALRRALARRLPDAPSLTAEEIAALPSLPAAALEAARLLAEAERARFDPTASPPSREAVARAMAKL
jgi:hypothetical protein